MWGGGGGEFLGADLALGFLGNSGHGDSADAAGGDVVEAAEGFGGDIDGVSMHGYPFAHADADGGKLAVFDPDTREPLAGGGGDAEALAGEDEGVFHGTDVGVEVFAEISEVNNRVADQLARAMVGGLSATIDLDVWVGQELGIEQGTFVAGSADGVNGRMLKGEVGFWGIATEDLLELFLLDAEGVLVADV